jgi:hypothetical protein
MARSRSLRMACVAGAALALAVLSWPVFAQTSPGGAKPAPVAAAAPATKPAASAAKSYDGGVEGYEGLHKHRMTPEELGRLRMLEIKSGAFRDAKAAANSTSLVGPPLSDREKVQHALMRLSFGAKPGQVEKILMEGGTTDQWQSWAKQQLEPDKIDDSETDKYIASRFPWSKMTVAQLYEKFPYRGDGPTWEVLKKELPEMVVARETMSNRQFKEVMCEFWRNHFCVDNSPGEAKPRSWAAANYEETVIRPNVFGKFKNMLFASARSPAMLDYLDNRLSKAGNWNENYARELMELHTLGADRGYGNYDVQELSKVLTGWNYDKEYNFTFRADWHQPGDKRVLGVSIPNGYEGGERALYLLATHKNTAEFISTKLCKYLVNDNPPPALVAKVASVFMRTEGDLPKVYAAIIFSPEFVERANYRAKFKTPVEFVASAQRAVDAKVDDTYEDTRTLARMGEEVYNCPDPTGYYDAAEAWMDSGVLTTRWDYALQLMQGGIKGVRPSPAVIAKYAAMKGDERFVTMVRDLIGDDIGDKTRQSLKEASDANDIPRMIGILLGSPSFQQQ